MRPPRNVLSDSDAVLICPHYDVTSPLVAYYDMQKQSPTDAPLLRFAAFATPSRLNRRSYCNFDSFRVPVNFKD